MCDSYHLHIRGHSGHETSSCCTRIVTELTWHFPESHTHRSTDFCFVYHTRLSDISCWKHSVFKNSATSKYYELSSGPLLACLLEYLPESPGFFYSEKLPLAIFYRLDKTPSIDDSFNYFFTYIYVCMYIHIFMYIFLKEFISFNHV